MLIVVFQAVHKGTTVAVKVRHPWVVNQIQMDLQVRAARSSRIPD
jgi:predicted unusual protein kinase regulating ubiquinone biosynthesis (AarF/ABC1/UbiB family)